MRRTPPLPGRLRPSLLAPILGLCALTACATAPPPAPQAAPRPPPGIEGRYRGTARLIRGDRFCPRSGPRVYEVENTSVTFSYSAATRRGARPTRIPLTAPIGPDGEFGANDGVGTLDGAVRDGTLEFTVASAECEHRWTMRKVP